MTLAMGYCLAPLPELGAKRRRYTAIMSLVGLVMIASTAMAFGASEPERNDGLPSPVAASTGAQAEPQVTSGEGQFAFPRVDPNHRRIISLLENALGYVAPQNGMIDPASGYLVEGWNHDPERGLFLRSFTQLTTIGQWIELLANIAAGHADNPYISRDEALERLAFAVKNLRHDQHDPKVSAKGLLGNFLGLEGGKRMGPMARSVERQDLLDTFGETKGEAIWQALQDEKWIRLQDQGRMGIVLRGEAYGSEHFEGALEPFGDDATKYRIMDILDRRIVMVIFGDNANLSASVGRTTGTLLHPNVKERPQVVALRRQLEQFLDDQSDGYAFLFDDQVGAFRFGWNATDDRFFGWDGPGGIWRARHMLYMVNEFRGPAWFVVVRHDLPRTAIGNQRFVMKPYRMAGGKVKYTLAPGAGSAFQALGLVLSMGEMDNAAWRTILENFVDAELDFVHRMRLPGFLSESYTGNGVQYTGSVGIPDIAVSPRRRITNAPSLYTLGAASMVAPGKIDKFLEANWPIISTMLTEHGPWEGYNTATKEPIKFQTSAHTLSLILGLLGTADENMSRYMDAAGLRGRLAELYRLGEDVDFLSDDVEITAWTSDGSNIESSRDGEGYRVQGQSVGEGGIAFVVSKPSGANLSGGRLKLSYRANKPIKAAVIRLDRKNGTAEPPSEVFASLQKADGDERTIDVPLPATPALAGIREIAIVFGNKRSRVALDVTITGFDSTIFTPK